MAYATVSTWKLTGDQEMDAIIAVLQEKYLPATKALGATQVMVIRTGEDTSAILAVYPDEATRNSVMEKIANLRSEASAEFSTEMTGELKGEVVAST